MKTNKSNYSLFENDKPEFTNLQEIANKHEINDISKSLENLLKGLNARIKKLTEELEDSDLKDSIKISGEIAKVIPALVNAADKLKIISKKGDNRENFENLIMHDEKAFKLSELLLIRISEINAKKR